MQSSIPESPEESEGRYLSLVEHAHDCILIQQRGRIVFANVAGAKLLGVTSPTDLIGLSIFCFIHSAGRREIRQRVESLALSSSVSLTDCRLVGQDGRLVEADVVWISIKYAGTPALQFIGRDNRERKRVERELEESRKQMQSLAVHLQTVREEQALRISREIHDGLAQLLTALSFHFSLLENDAQSLGESFLTQLSSIQRLIDEATLRTQRICTELYPSILDELGLEAAMEWQINDFTNRTGLCCDVYPMCEIREFDQRASTAIFRIVQESLNNVEKHANASTVEIRWSTNGQQFRLEITDDGEGIREDDLISSESLGIVGMKERASTLGGKIKISSAERGGTKVSLVLPLSTAGGV